MTWHIQLPVDRSPTENQSSLYIAIWFGMTLSDPYAWMNQCFLELQFYPDSSWSDPFGTVDGSWDGAAVAWQIQASSGYENPCYYSPLMTSGNTSSYFHMTQGDSVNVTMNGWIGDPYGENISVDDTSSGQSSFVTMYNSSGHYPVDPAYATSSWSNALWWTPGGETPVSFAFETGHAVNPAVPENNSFGGCSPGAPPPTPWNGAVPCPSYEPGAWANDTLVPWQIAAPTFFNATARQNATQVGFSQDLGGLAFIDGTDYFGSFPYTCLGQEMSAYCTYPWYSYSCSTHAYNFGATDYPTTTDDFDKALEFKSVTTQNAAGEGYYPVTNESVPSCGATSTVTAGTSGSGSGTVDFLNGTVTNAVRVFSGVASGNYSVAAWASPGSTFDHWSVVGGATVAPADDPWANVDVTGASVVTAVFDLAGTVGGLEANVTFASSLASARFAVIAGVASSGFGIGASPETWEIPNGTTLALAPGLYSLEGQPPPGYNFTGWAGTSGVRVSAPTFPDTVLDVPAGANATVTASFAAASGAAEVLIETPNPSDVVTLDGVNYSGGFAVTGLAVGTFRLNFTPAAGSTFVTWEYGGLAMMTNFSQSTWATFESGVSEILAVSSAVEAVTLNDSGSNGEVAWNTEGNATALSVPSGTTIDQTTTSASSSSPVVFGIVATPAPGWGFANWTVSPGAVAFVQAPLGSATNVLFNSTGVTPVTITANYVASGSANGSLTVFPSGSGSVTLGFSSNHLTGGSGPIPNASFYVVEFPNSGDVVTGLTVTNGTATLVQGSSPTTRPWVPWVWVVTAVGPSTALNATFAPLTYPVTFVANPPTGDPVATLNGTSLGVGQTLWLANGTYSLSVALGSGVTFSSWTSSWSRLAVASTSLATTTVNVTGPGTVYALGSTSTPNPPVSATVSPNGATVTPGEGVVFNATVACLGGLACPNGTTYAWSVGNASVGTLNASTGGSVLFRAAAVYGTTDLLVNATLNGSSVMSAPVVVEVIPNLATVTVHNETSSQIYAGQTVSLVADPGCTDGAPCPTGITFSWFSEDPALGTVSPTGHGTATFQSADGVNGSTGVGVTAILEGSANVTGFAFVSVAYPLLTSVTVGPSTVESAPGASTNFSAAPACTDGLACPTGTTFTWALSSASLGSLSTATGATTEFTAGTTNAAGWLNATGTLHGVTVAAASVPIVVELPAAALTGVVVTPATVSLAAGAMQTFTAVPTCSPGPCPSGVAIAWALSAPVGSVSALSGSTTVVTASAAGTATLYANATLSGVTDSGSAVVTVTTTPGGGSTSSTPFYESPLLWIAVVVLLVVVVAAVILLRRGPSPPSTETPAGSPGAGSDGGTPPSSP